MDVKKELEKYIAERLEVTHEQAAIHMDKHTFDSYSYWVGAQDAYRITQRQIELLEEREIKNIDRMGAEV